MRVSVLVLALCMLLTGTINTIATKYQDLTVVGHLPDGTPITFQHPAVQSACMFFGESLCLIPYFYMRWRRRKAKRLNPAYVPMHPEEKRSRRIGRILAFAVPTLCDATATTLMNVGLFYTYASTYQMLRGTLVLFAGMFTISILRRQLFIHNWLGMVLITAGAALVGASSVLYDSPSGNNVNLLSTAVDPGLLETNVIGTGSHLHYSASYSRVASRGLHAVEGSSPYQQYSMLPAAVTPAGGVDGHTGHHISRNSGGSFKLHAESAVAAAPLFGDVLVVVAQMFTALQFILEEKYLVQFKVPALLAVGLEGCWGLVLCSFILPVMSFINGSDGLPLDDAVAAFRAIFSIPELTIAVFGSILSIAFFNFFGISVTKSLSGAARATIDACRTMFIWLYALHAGWENFHMLQVVGFVVLISGTSLYNEILKSCLPGLSAGTEGLPQETTHRRRQTRPSRPGEAAAAVGATAAAGDELVIPLLADKADETSGQDPSLPQTGQRAPPVPLRRPAPAHTQAVNAPQASTGSGSWVYHMARSMRMGIHTLSPQSLAATATLAPEDESEGYSESESGSYMSSATGGLLASSFSRESGMGGAGQGSSAQPDDAWNASGAAVAAQQFSVSPGSQRPPIDPSRARVSFSSSPGRNSLPSGDSGGQVGGLSASLRGPASASAGSITGGASSGAGGVLKSALRRDSARTGVPRSVSSEALRQGSSSTDQAGSSGRPPPSPQQ